MASPSRMTTRSTPRTSRGLATMPRRRAAPDRASAASGPGQVTSSADERPGSVSEPWARNAPRQAASESQSEPLTMAVGQAAGRAAAGVDEAGLAGELLAVGVHAHEVAVALAQAAGVHDGHLALVPEDLGDVLAQAARGGRGVELGLDDDLAADDVQARREAQDRRDLGLAAAGLGDLQARELVLHRCRHRHARASCHPRQQPSHPPDARDRSVDARTRSAAAVRR